MKTYRFAALCRLAVAVSVMLLRGIFPVCALPSVISDTMAKKCVTALDTAETAPGGFSVCVACDTTDTPVQDTLRNGVANISLTGSAAQDSSMADRMEHAAWAGVSQIDTVRPDTTIRLTGWDKFRAGVDRMTTTRAYKMTYIAVPLMVAGIAVNSERNHFCDLRNSYMPTFRHDFDDYLQYAPMALMFGLKVAGGDSSSVVAGEHYVLPPYVLKAGSTGGSFPIYLKNTSDFKNKAFSLSFALKESEMFDAGAKEYASLKLNIKDKEERPQYWDDDPVTYMPLKNFFGTYSSKKYQFIIKVTGKVILRVIYQGTPTPPYEISYFEAQYLQAQCRLAVEEYNSNPDNPDRPLSDENGPITF